jgi:SNF2 family DNA or RNA helicase
MVRELMNESKDQPTDHVDVSTYPLAGVLRDHQARALQEAGLKAGHCYFLDPGAGKTAIVIAEASRLFQSGEIDGMIIVAPNGPHQQIIDEQLPLWCVVPWQGIHNKQRKRDIDAFFGRAAIDKMGVLAINYDALGTPRGDNLIQSFREKYPRVYTVFDESSKLKNPSAKRTHEARMLGGVSAYRRLLSGTPILRGLEDLFTQYDIAEPGITGHRRFTSYRAYYCTLEPIPGARSRFAKRIVGYRNEGELKRRTAAYTTRVKSTEFRPEANPSFMQILAPMTDSQAQMYRSMKADLWAEIRDSLVTVDHALTQMGKLLQIASGYIATDEGGGIEWISSRKIDAINDLLDDLDEPVVVFAPFIPLQDRIEEAIVARGDRYVHRYRSREDVNEWKTTGGVIIGNQSSGLGIGQNLQSAAATIYAANTFSSEARWQSICRTDRIGQEKHCRFWDIVAPDTIESKVLQALQSKEMIANQTMDDIRSFLITE